MLSKAPQTIEFAGRTNFPFPYLIDTEYKVVKDYVGTYKPNTWPQTNTFVVNKSGLVTFSSGPGTPVKTLRNELQKIGAGK